MIFLNKKWTKVWKSMCCANYTAITPWPLSGHDNTILITYFYRLLSQLLIWKKPATKSHFKSSSLFAILSSEKGLYISIMFLLTVRAPEANLWLCDMDWRTEIRKMWHTSCRLVVNSDFPTFTYKVAFIMAFYSEFRSI